MGIGEKCIPACRNFDIRNEFFRTVVQTTFYVVLNYGVPLNVYMPLVCASCSVKISASVETFFSPAGESQICQRASFSLCCHTEVSGQEKEVRQEVNNIAVHAILDKVEFVFS